MNKVIKGILITGIVGVTISCGLFTYNCFNGSYNENILSKMDGDILYTKRDKDLNIKIYTSKENLKNEKLIYEHKGSGIDNDNIIEISYDEETKIITFVAYNKDRDNWSYYEIDKNNNITPLDDNYQPKTDEDYMSGVENDKYKIKSINGSMYITNKATNKTELLKKFIGIYDGKFSNGYTPVKISDDGKYLFYTYGGHNTPIGNLLESYINKNYKFDMYVMDLETKEVSRYVEFEDIIFLN